MTTWIYPVSFGFVHCNSVDIMFDPLNLPLIKFGITLLLLLPSQSQLVFCKNQACDSYAFFMRQATPKLK